MDFLHPDEDRNLLTTSPLTNLLRPKNTDGFLDETDNELKKINNNWIDNAAYINQVINKLFFLTYDQVILIIRQR